MQDYLLLKRKHNKAMNALADKFSKYILDYANEQGGLMDLEGLKTEIDEEYCEYWNEFVSLDPKTLDIIYVEHGNPSNKDITHLSTLSTYDLGQIVRLINDRKKESDEVTD